MKQAVPPPLTAIQTPRTEESGFPFPDDPKEVSTEIFVLVLESMPKFDSERNIFKLGVGID